MRTGLVQSAKAPLRGIVWSAVGIRRIRIPKYQKSIMCCGKQISSPTEAIGTEWTISVARLQVIPDASGVENWANMGQTTYTAWKIIFLAPWLCCYNFESGGLPNQDSDTTLHGGWRPTWGHCPWNIKSTEKQSFPKSGSPWATKVIGVVVSWSSQWLRR